MGGRVGGWSEDWRVMLNSTQDQIKWKLKFELSLAIYAWIFVCGGDRQLCRSNKENVDFPPQTNFQV